MLPEMIVLERALGRAAKLLDFREYVPIVEA
jgi:hypothetical protein